MNDGLPLDPEIGGQIELLERRMQELVSGAEGAPRDSQTILAAGGKRLRPMLVLLSGMEGRYDADALGAAAMAIELIHTASLVHDDVLDQAPLRRGRPTVNAVSGERAAVACGDYLFGHAFTLLVGLGQPNVTEIAAQAVLRLTEGEFQQMATAHVADQGVDLYMSKITNKTASLIAASCRIGGLVGACSPTSLEALEAYGLHLGLAFQVYDDILDVAGDVGQLGKAVGTDLRDGTVTLPVLLAVEDRPELREAITRTDLSDGEVGEVIAAVKATGAIERSKEVARSHAQEAIRWTRRLSRESVKGSLLALAEFVVSRYH